MFPSSKCNTHTPMIAQTNIKAAKLIIVRTSSAALAADTLAG